MLRINNQLVTLVIVILCIIICFRLSSTLICTLIVSMILSIIYGKKYEPTSGFPSVVTNFKKFKINEHGKIKSHFTSNPNTIKTL